MYNWAYADLDFNTVIDIRGISGIDEMDFNKKEFEEIVRAKVCKLFNSTDRIVSSHDIHIYYKDNNALVVIKVKTMNSKIIV